MFTKLFIATSIDTNKMPNLLIQKQSGFCNFSFYSINTESGENKQRGDGVAPATSVFLPNVFDNKNIFCTIFL